MSLRYDTINLNSLIAKAKNCTNPDCEKVQAMNEVFLDQIESRKIKNIIVNGIEFKLKRR